MKTIAQVEYFGTTTFCEYKVRMTLVKRVFRKGYILGEFFNLSSGYSVVNDTKFKTFTACNVWVEDVKQRIERGEL